MGVLDLLTLMVLTVVGMQLVQATRRTVDARQHVVRIVRGLHWRHIVYAVPVFATVLVALVLLIQVPGLDFGWWTAIGGIGNPALGASEHGLEGDAALMLSGVFAALLVVSMPLLVEREEWVFRRGAEQRGFLRNAAAALTFGVAHVIVGIPIGAGIALSIGGAYFTHMYLRAFRAMRSQDAALMESTRAHLGYNLVIISLVVTAVVVGA